MHIRHGCERTVRGEQAIEQPVILDWRSQLATPWEDGPIEGMQLVRDALRTAFNAGWRTREEGAARPELGGPASGVTSREQHDSSAT